MDLRPLALATALLSIGLAGCLGDEEPATAVVGPETPLPFCASVCDRILADKDAYEYEPSIAVNPTDPQNIVVGLHDDPGTDSEYAVTDPVLGIPLFLGPGFFYLSAMTTFDGGETWSHQYLPFLTEADPDSEWNRFCNGGDPVLVFDPDGTLYYFGLGISCSDITLSGAYSHLFVTKSTDGGTTWSEPTIIWSAPGVAQFQDKQWAAVDPSTGHLAVAWNGFTSCVSGLVVFACGSWDLLYSVSDDGGETWSTPPMTVTSGGYFPGTGPWDEQPMNFFAVPAFGSDGSLHVSYRACGGACVKVATSVDDGTTWDKVQLARLDHLDRDDGEWVPLTYTVMDVDRSGGPADGRLYVSYHNGVTAEGEGEDLYDVLLQWSDDGGATWSEPLSLGTTTDATAQAPGNATDRFHHWMDVDEYGTVHTMFFQRVEGAVLEAVYSHVRDEVVRAEAVSAPWDAAPGDQTYPSWGHYETISAAAGRVGIAWTIPRQEGGFDLDAMVAVFDLPSSDAVDPAGAGHEHDGQA